MQAGFGPRLGRSFYARPAQVVARDLLGRVIQHGDCAGRIVETEAYLGTGDLAAHSARGLTPRTRILFGPPGYAYVYFIYGLHECLNIVAEPEGVAGCVLIRALEPLAGIETMRERRKKEDLRSLTSGPGKLTQAFGITRAHYGADLTSGELLVRRGTQEPFQVDATPRIGIRRDTDLPLRFLIRGSPFVS